MMVMNMPVCVILWHLAVIVPGTADGARGPHCLEYGEAVSPYPMPRNTSNALSQPAVGRMLPVATSTLPSIWPAAPTRTDIH